MCPFDRELIHDSGCEAESGFGSVWEAAGQTLMHGGFLICLFDLVLFSKCQKRISSTELGHLKRDQSEWAAQKNPWF